jgi:hypothetical protein
MRRLRQIEAAAQHVHQPFREPGLHAPPAPAAPEDPVVGLHAAEIRGAEAAGGVRDGITGTRKRFSNGLPTHYAWSFCFVRDYKRERFAS